MSSDPFASRPRGNRRGARLSNNPGRMLQTGEQRRHGETRDNRPSLPRPRRPSSRTPRAPPTPSPTSRARSRSSMSGQTGALPAKPRYQAWRNCRPNMPARPVAVVPISVGKGDDEPAGRAFIGRNPPLTFYSEPTYKLAFAFSPVVENMPTTIIYDKTGVERARAVGRGGLVRPGRAPGRRQTSARVLGRKTQAMTKCLEGWHRRSAYPEESRWCRASQSVFHQVAKSTGDDGRSARADLAGLEGLFEYGSRRTDRRRERRG